MRLNTFIILSTPDEAFTIDIPEPSKTTISDLKKLVVQSIHSNPQVLHPRDVRLYKVMDEGLGLFDSRLELKEIKVKLRQLEREQQHSQSKDGGRKEEGELPQKDDQHPGKHQQEKADFDDSTSDFVIHSLSTEQIQDCVCDCTWLNNPLSNVATNFADVLQQNSDETNEASPDNKKDGKEGSTNMANMERIHLLVAINSATLNMIGSLPSNPGSNQGTWGSSTTSSALSTGSSLVNGGTLESLGNNNIRAMTPEAYLAHSTLPPYEGELFLTIAHT
jgi:hypothetical protein